MKRVLAVLAVLAVATLSLRVVTTDSVEAQPITGGNPAGISRVHHGSAFYGLGTSGTPLDLRHDCSTGSGLAWSGSAWNCAAMGGGSGGSGFTVAGWGLIGSGSTVSLDSTGCSTGYVPTWNGTTWACASPGTLGAGSISISVGSASSPVALPTLGTIDWIHSLAAGTAGTRSVTCNAGTTSTCWMKQAGGIFPGAGWMDWVGLSFASPSTVAGLWTFTAGSADSMTTTALSSTQVSSVSASGTSGMGMRFMLPSAGGNVQRVARLYLYQYDNLATCVATAMDGTATGSSATNDTGSGGVVSQTVWTVTYKTNYAVPVNVLCTITTTRTGAGNPAIGWAAESLGPT